MPTTFTETPVLTIPVDLPRKKWTRAECEAMERIGLFEGQRYELVGGELINKMGKKRRHVNAVSILIARLLGIFGEGFVNQEAPIDVAPEDNPTNEPEPDAIVLTRSSSQFQAAPRPDEVRLVVEVSDTTADFDLGPKASLYARAGIVEYWVLDIARRRMVVHRDPANGRYQSITAYADDESPAPLAAPHAAIRVKDLL